MTKPLFGDTKTVDLSKPVLLDSQLDVAGAGNGAPAVYQTTEIINAPLAVDDSYIDALGTDSSKKIPTLSTTLAEKAKASDMDGFGVKIGELISTAKGWDLANQQQKGLIGRVKSFIGRAKEDAKDHYRTVEDRISDLMKELNAIADTQKQTFTDLQNMILQAGVNAKQLSADIDDGKLRLQQLRDSIQHLQSVVDHTPESHQKLQAAMRLEKRLDRKIRDLDAARTVLVQSGVMMQAMSDTAIGIVDKFHHIDTISISIWRDQFTLFMMSVAQEKAANVFDKVDEATNRALQQNAARIRSTALRVEQSNNRGVVTRETIQKVNDEMIGMLEDLKKENDGARARRLEDMQSFEKNRQALQEALRNSAKA